MIEKQFQTDDFSSLHSREHGDISAVEDSNSRTAHEREIERLNRLYAALSELNRIVVRVKSREELFREVCRITTAKAGFKVAWIGWPDPETHRVIPIAGAGEKQDYLDEISVYADDRPEGRGPTRHIRSRGQVVHRQRLCGRPLAWCPGRPLPPHEGSGP